MATEQRTTRQAEGMARLHVQSLDGRWLGVGPFKDFPAAMRFGQGLLRRRSLVKVVKVEHRNGNAWKPVRTLGRV